MWQVTASWTTGGKSAELTSEPQPLTVGRARPVRARLWGEQGWLRAQALREWLIVTLVACGLAGLLSGFGVTRAGDRLLYDALDPTACKRPPPNRVILVAIDDDSLKAVGAWPWSREIHAHLLDRLTVAAPAAVGYDVMFLEPGPGDDALARAPPRFRPHGAADLHRRPGRRRAGGEGAASAGPIHLICGLPGSCGADPGRRRRGPKQRRIRGRGRGLLAAP